MSELVLNKEQQRKLRDALLRSSEEAMMFKDMDGELIVLKVNEETPCQKKIAKQWQKLKPSIKKGETL